MAGIHLDAGFLPNRFGHLLALPVSKEDIPANFLRHYPAHKSKQLNVSELAGLSDISRTTAYKYIGLLEA